MRVNKGYDVLNYKGIMEDLNRHIQNSEDESYIKGLEKAKTIVKSNRVINVINLEARVKNYAFNNEVNLDEASKIVIEEIFKNNPSSEWYRKLFGC